MNFLTRLFRRASPLVAGAAFLCFAPPEARADSPHGWAGRLMPEASLARGFVSHRGSVEAPGIATEFVYFDDVERQALGAHVEWGYLYRLGKHAGVYPRLSGSWAPTLARKVDLVIAGVPHQYRYTNHWWDVATGAEVQFSKRRWGVGLDLGVGGFNRTMTPLNPDGLRLSRGAFTGPFARLQGIMRLPVSPRVSLGGALWSSAFYEGNDGDIHWRHGVSLLVEWDEVAR